MAVRSYHTVRPVAEMGGSRKRFSALREPAPSFIRVSEIISALSYALDLTEGRPMGHSVRSCVVGMRLAQQIGVPLAEQADLYYALLLKDAGCSSNASKLFHILQADEIRAKRDVKLTDWTRVGWESFHYALTHVATALPFTERVRTLLRAAANQQRESCELVKIRCERGASIARRMGFPEPVAEAIHSLDEHWNGGGYPDGLRGTGVPLFARIMNLAQTLEAFWVNRGPEAAIQVARQRSKRWFDPDLVKAAISLSQTGALWTNLDSDDAISQVMALEPEDRRMLASEETIENICIAFAEVIDAKSPFTYRHSNGVADAAVTIARGLDIAEPGTTFIRRAALVHDLGKLSVPNSILEKPGKLDGEEWQIMKRHPYYTFEILRHITGFEELGVVAGAHHERLDGSGYFRQWTGDQISLPARVVAVADVYDALTSKRPYRDALPPETVFGIMRKEAPCMLDASCVEALIAAKSGSSSMSSALSSLATQCV